MDASQLTSPCLAP